jgi:hypothetical protein
MWATNFSPKQNVQLGGAQMRRFFHHKRKGEYMDIKFTLTLAAEDTPTNAAYAAITAIRAEVARRVEVAQRAALGAVKRVDSARIAGEIAGYNSILYLLDRMQVE